MKILVAFARRHPIHSFVIVAVGLARLLAARPSRGRARSAERVVQGGRAVASAEARPADSETRATLAFGARPIFGRV